MRSAAPARRRPAAGRRGIRTALPRGVVATLAAALVCLAGCLDTPQAPVLDNPLAEPPQTELLQAPAEGQTVTAAEVLFRWQGNHRLVREWSYCLDGADWSAWAAVHEVELVLDEGKHRFEVKGRVPDEPGYAGQEEVVPLAREFVVDAIHGPALWLSPRQVRTTVGQEVVLAVMAEEVAGAMLAHLQITFDKARLAWQDAGEGALLAQNGAQVIVLSEAAQAQGEGVVDLAAVGGQPAGVTGSGPLAVLRFRALAPGTAQVAVAEGAELRDAANRGLLLRERVGCEVVVE
ncbi:MAG: cohesin domain-containing protein [Candidatus Latescibacterota bacterium]